MDTQAENLAEYLGFRILECKVNITKVLPHSSTFYILLNPVCWARLCSAQDKACPSPGGLPLAVIVCIHVQRAARVCFVFKTA